MTLLNESAKGVYVIAATPFTDNGGIDLASIDRAIDSYIACGIQGITILGMMGEAAKLSEDESRSVASRMLARAGHVAGGGGAGGFGRRGAGMSPAECWGGPAMCRSWWG